MLKKSPTIFAELEIGAFETYENSMRNINNDTGLSIYIGKKQLKQITEPLIYIYIPITHVDENAYTFTLQQIDPFGIDTLERYVFIKDKLYVYSIDQNLLKISTLTQLNLDSKLCLIYSSEKYNYKFNKIVDMEMPKGGPTMKTAEFILERKV